MLKSAIALVIAGVAAAPALANDTSAELATGGLIFVRNDNVEMRSEDLAISAKEVSVRYRFFNTSDKDVTVLVAFPMPEIKIEEPDQNIAVPTEDPVNFLAFATTVNGAPLARSIFAAGCLDPKMIYASPASLRPLSGPSASGAPTRMSPRPSSLKSPVASEKRSAR